MTTTDNEDNEYVQELNADAAVLAHAVVGHRIVSSKLDEGSYGNTLTLTLDNGTKVQVDGYGDCCAYADVTAFLLHPDRVDHIITGVTTEDEATQWHIYADWGNVLDLTIGWSEGSGYYGFGISVNVIPVSS